MVQSKSVFAYNAIHIVVSIERNLKGTSFIMPSLKDDKLVVFRADEDLEDDEQKKQIA